ncbi:MAG: hypothetical protein OEY52_13925 [Gammaproteobacteria bacterium]|nr:hypothetical protein [Gammaproteobacteria bacterium]
MDKRTTVELLLELDSDYQRCCNKITKLLDEGERDENGNTFAETDFDARQLIRSTFAYIEGAMFVLKVEASFNAEEKGVELTDQQQQFIFERSFSLNNKGDICENNAKISLTKNIKFAFSVFSEANEVDNILDTKSDWWSKLKSSIKVRDRLTHPRYHADLDVTPKEVIDAVTAKVGFDETLHAIINASKA